MVEGAYRPLAASILPYVNVLCRKTSMERRKISVREGVVGYTQNSATLPAAVVAGSVLTARHGPG